MKVLVTGATGYIGGRLVPRLLERGHAVRVLVRDAGRVTGRPWADDGEVVQGDLLHPDELAGAFDDVDVAYYLVHSMYAGRGYAERDRQAARNLCRLASSVRHVIYLGGLLPRARAGDELRASRHLSSRAEIGRILAASLPLTELRAGPIIGSGSASFEMLRYMTERTPVMLAPAWVRNEVQPIAIRDVLSYLVHALDRGPCGVVEVGSEQISYQEMILKYAELRGLRRLVVPVPPFLPSWIGALWIGLITPIPRALAAPLVQGMARPLVARKGRARRFFPEIQPIPYERAVELALLRIQQRAVATRWSGALTDVPAYEYRDDEGLIREVRTLHVDASPEEVYRVFTGLGDARGWLAWNWACRTRALMDRMVGGPGLKRGRRHPDELLTGEVVDCWRAEAVSPPRLLRLRAEMKLPGRAWLQWEATPDDGGTRLVQTASFAPRGLAGALYWYVLYPFHRLIFTDMIREIGSHARPEAGTA
jgi:uncharacterized protein YbjT (DUF2867 family)/uncharacterized protein YndB with AHSA1/START domain